jgi:hypothetical protein
VTGGKLHKVEEAGSRAVACPAEEQASPLPGCREADLDGAVGPGVKDMSSVQPSAWK